MNKHLQILKQCLYQHLTTSIKLSYTTSRYQVLQSTQYKKLLESHTPKIAKFKTQMPASNKITPILIITDMAHAHSKKHINHPYIKTIHHAS